VAAAETWTKVLLSRQGSGTIDAAAMAQLTAIGARELHQYPAFTLVQAPQQNVNQLVRRANQFGINAERRDDFDKVFLPRMTVDTRLAAPRTDYAEGTTGLYVVQYVGPPKPAWLDITRYGAIPLQAVPQNALIVTATPLAIRQLEAGAPMVQWVDRYDAAMKTALFATTEPTARLIVQVANVSGREAVRDQIASLPGANARAEQVGGDYFVHAQLTGAQADALLRHPLVMGIHREPHFRPSDERQALSGSMTGGGTAPAPGYIAWLASNCAVCSNLNAEGFRVDIADTALDNATNAAAHADLAGREFFAGNFNPEPQCPFGADLRCDRFGHGTMVAGVIAGNGATAVNDTGGYRLGVGVAPSAGVKSTKIFNVFNAQPAGTIFDWASDAVNAPNNAYIQNHSHNDYPDAFNPPQYVSGQYTLTSRQYDMAVRDADNNWANGVTPVTITVSSGNIDQSVGDANPLLVLPPATAKNVIAVGAAENYRPDQDPAACHGTLADSYLNLSINSKRSMLNASIFKPDLVAPGTMIVNPRSGGQDGNIHWCDDAPYGSFIYTMESGTSFSAPAAAGAALLASRVYSASPSAAQPALLKAILTAGARSVINGTDRRTGGTIGARPNNRVGFGLLTLAPLFSSLGNQYVNENTILFTSGASWSQEYTPVDQNQTVTIVLAWSDAPAAAGATNTLVNDLDLFVDALQLGMCSRTYVGNYISQTSEASIPGVCGFAPAVDSANNVEIVRFIPGNANTFRVTVRGTSISAGAVPNQPAPNQDFALYISNARL